MQNSQKNIPAHQRSYYNRSEFINKFGSHVDQQLEQLEVLAPDAQLALLHALQSMCRDNARKATAAIRTDSTHEKLNAGDIVLVVGGEAKFMGSEGELKKVGRTRCLVKVSTNTARGSRTLYLHISDVKLRPSITSAENA